MSRIKTLSAFALSFLALVTVAQAQVTYSETNVSLKTIGGGPPGGNSLCGNPSGFVDGNTLQYSQFDGPVATALNSQGTLFIADYTNNAVRMVSLVGDTASSTTTTSAILANLPGVIGVAVDAADNLYVVSQGDKLLRKYNTSLNLLIDYALPYTPSAMAVSLDAFTNVFVAFTNGVVLELVQNGTSITHTNIILGAGSKIKPGGLAWRSDGVLAVSDLNADLIYLLAGTNNSVPVAYTGGGPGWVDGVPGAAQFNQPMGLAWSPDKQLIVADRLNNAVRRIDATGITSTIYGVSSNLWGQTFCTEGIFAGWVDGPAGATNGAATGDAPASVLLNSAGTIYVTELHYDLLREVTGVAFANVSGTNGGGTNAVTNNIVPPPVISPAFGYFPDCQTITVTSAAPNVYYTTDGTAATTNSTPVLLTQVFNGTQFVYEGTFQWCNSLQDLTTLQLVAANGTNVSVVTNGIPSPTNFVGFPGNKVAGIGSTAVIPIVADLKNNVKLASLQFVAAFFPKSPAPPILASTITLLNITTNDFRPVVGSAAANGFVNYTRQDDGEVLGLGIPTGGSNLLTIQNFAVVAMLAVPIPTNALEGQTYTLELFSPSGTSDGAEGNVPLTNMPPVTLTISNYQYFVGDSAPPTGYDAGEFGNGILDNSDVNAALQASLGIHVPYPFSDAFNAMDVYPPDTTNTIGGDGFITFLDWQYIFLRSLGFDQNNWVRFWTTGGTLGHQPINWSPGQTIPIGVSPGQTHIAAAKAVANPLPGAVWLRQAALHAGTVTQATGTCSIPLYINVLPGSSLAGLQFHATLVANGNAPMPPQIQFNPAPGLPAPFASQQGLSPTDIIYAWSLFAPFNPALQGSNYLGAITFQVPRTAYPGQSYTVHLTGVDGAPDLTTTYQLEGVPGTAWVDSPALAPAQITSDDWRMHFFGSLTNANAQDNADPDGDGMPNWQEYLAGTNPTNALSALQFSAPSLPAGGSTGFNFGWLTAPGRTYVLESSPTLANPVWTGINTNAGNGNVFQISITNRAAGARFYRLRLQP